MQNVNRKFDWGSLIIGIFFVVVGFMTMNRPVATLVTLTVLFGILSIVKGIYELFFSYDVNRLVSRTPIFAIIVGVFDIIIGILFLTNVGTGSTVVAYLFAIWFIVDAIAGLINASYIKTFSKGYYIFVIILEAIGVIVGFMLLFNPVVSALSLAVLISFYFFVFGITYIIRAF